MPLIDSSLWVAVILLPLLHYVADFELQTDWMAVNKSKHWGALGLHVLIYSAVFAVVFGPLFGLITFITHFITDALTSRWSRRKFPWTPWNKNLKGVMFYRDDEGVDGRSRHRFFSVIGFDQMIHAYTLLATVLWLDARVIWL